jgi:hypothetical protein
MRRILLLGAGLLGLASLSGCYAPDAAQRALFDAGYTGIEVSREPLLAFSKCADGDRFETWFTAVSPAGRRVSGAVCSGWFKGSTVRVD